MLNGFLMRIITPHFFHSLLQSRKARKPFDFLQIGDSFVFDPDILRSHTIDLYAQLFNASTLVIATDFLVISAIIPHTFLDQDNLLLTVTPYSTEIKNVVFSLDSNSALGPDSFESFFLALLGLGG